MKWFFLSLLILIAALYIFIQTPFGQNWIARQVTNRLSRDLHTKVSVQHVDFSLFNRMHLEGILVEDRKGDTLLYAGDLKVRITDWFFLKKNVDLKYIGIENALIKFQRTDSVWSQQFLFDYFSSPSTPQKKGGIQFHFKKLDLKNVSFLNKDAWQGQDMTIHFGSLGFDANEIDFAKKLVDINNMSVDQPLVALSNYKGLKPAKEKTDTVSGITVDSRLKWNQGGWVMHVNKLNIKNGVFKNDKQTEEPLLTSFDGRHIEFREINGELSDIRWNKDSITSQISLQTKERSGLEVKKLLTYAKFTPNEMAFDKLDIQTNNSHIRKYFRMSFNDFGSLGDFIHAVTMQGNFDNSEIDSDDIAFFAPALKRWKKKIILKGNIRGTVDALAGKDIIVQAGSNTLLNGDISLTGLPDIYETFIDFKANDLRTTYGDAVTFVPGLRRVTSPDLKKIHYLNFKGSFTGFLRDFVTFGTIQTNLGTVKTDLNMKLPRGQEAVYSGNLATDNFLLGEFLGDNDIGSVSFSATVKGRGFNAKTRNTLIDGTIRFADYKKYRYQNITVKGKLDKNLFEGLASIRDENADLDLNGIIDLNNKVPSFNLKADVTKANLKNLNLTKDDYKFKGKLDLDFNGNTIDNFLGYAKITDGEITKDGRRLPFDSLVLSSTFINNEKRLTAVSNEFNATISGDFSLKELPAAFTYILNKYYPAYIDAPARLPRNQKIKFDIAALYADEYLQLIDSNISGFNNSHFSGSLNLGDHDVNFTIDSVDVPQFRYRQYSFDDVKLKAHGNNDSLIITGNIRNIRINDSLHIANAIFKINARNDSSTVMISTGTNQALEKARINAKVFTYNDGLKIKFEPSNFTINGKTWTIDENGELEFRSSQPAKGQLVLQEGEQKILLKTQPSLKGAWNDLKIELTNLNIGDLSPYFLPHNRLEGLVSGTIFAEDPTHNLKITSEDIQTKFLRLDNDSLGEVKASFNYDNSTKELTFKGNTLNLENYLGFDGHIFISDPLKVKIALKAKNYEIKVLERFLGSLFTDMRGYLTGDVDLDGDFKNLSVTGKGRLKDAGLKVIFTQCFYKIEDTDIELTPQEINLDGIVLTDTVTGNPIYIKGGIQHESFKNMFYDLYITTRKPKTTNESNNRPVQLLNTSYRDNKQFFGNVKGTGSLSLTGPQSDLFMKIDAFASSRDSSNITIPSSTSRETGLADFLVERKFGHEMSDIGFNDNISNIIYDVDVTVNPRVNVKVILDELTGDEIKGKGTGTLKIRSGTAEPLSLRGRFDIDEGDYLFTFQSFFKKPFVLRKGENNFIEWNGDPYDARINLTAYYTAKNVSYAPLTTHWANIDRKIATARSDVYVVAKLTDKLFSPHINFSLEFPPSSAASDDPALAFSLQQLQKNMSEMNKQATYLVVFGIFAPIENSGTISIQEIATNSLSGIFFNVINEQVRKIVSNIFKTEKLNFNFNSSVYNKNVIAEGGSGFNLGSNVNASIGSSLFKNKVIISLGGSVEGLLQSGNIQQNVQLLPNATIEILLNESGTFRANLFYRQNIDYLTTSTSGAGRTNRAGVGLSYRKEADTIWELFFKKKKKTDTAQPLKTPEVKKEGDKE